MRRTVMLLALVLSVMWGVLLVRALVGIFACKARSSAPATPSQIKRELDSANANLQRQYNEMRAQDAEKRDRMFREWGKQ